LIAIQLLVHDQEVEKELVVRIMRHSIADEFYRDIVHSGMSIFGGSSENDCRMAWSQSVTKAPWRMSDQGHGGDLLKTNEVTGSFF